LHRLLLLLLRCFGKSALLLHPPLQRCAFDSAESAFVLDRSLRIWLADLPLWLHRLLLLLCVGFLHRGLHPLLLLLHLLRLRLLLLLHRLLQLHLRLIRLDHLHLAQLRALWLRQLLLLLRASAASALFVASACCCYCV
jgi:hypothetical protein